MLICLFVAALLCAACSGGPDGRAADGVRAPTSAPSTGAVSPRRFVDPVFDTAVATRGVAYATAPALGTGRQTSLALDLYEPAGDNAPTRPAIVWIHGGGFASGSRSDISEVADAYAKRGYVTLSIDYRVDPGNRCQDLQRNTVDETARPAEAARCRDAMLAAQHDAQAAVRWVRAHAAALRVDIGRVAVGGFSAGALTAVHVAERSDQPGDVGDLGAYSSAVSAALAASGCNAEPATIDAGDAPVFLVASENDRLVAFSCVRATEQRIRAVGGSVETMYF
jgi:pectinesterase